MKIQTRTVMDIRHSEISVSCDDIYKECDFPKECIHCPFKNLQEINLQEILHEYIYMKEQESKNGSKG